MHLDYGWPWWQNDDRCFAYLQLTSYFKNLIYHIVNPCFDKNRTFFSGYASYSEYVVNQLTMWGELTMTSLIIYCFRLYNHRRLTHLIIFIFHRTDKNFISNPRLNFLFENEIFIMTFYQFRGTSVRYP